VEKLMTSFIENIIDKKASEKETEFKACTTIKLNFLPVGVELPQHGLLMPKIDVQFIAEQPPTLTECILRAIDTLRGTLESSPNQFFSLNLAVTQCLNRINAERARWGREHMGAQQFELPEPVLKLFQDTCSTLDSLEQKSAQQARKAVNQLMIELQKAGDLPHE
jgi:hypothetical protein